MVAKLLSFSWFEFGNIKRLWNEGNITDVDFWAKPLSQYMWWDREDGIHFLLPPQMLKTYYEQEKIEKLFLGKIEKNQQDRWFLYKGGFGKEIKEYYNKIKSQRFDWETASSYFCGFVDVLKNNKQLIIFAQREYLNSAFGDYNQMENIEDTNVPWDWDHIYPNEWVYRKKNCNQSIKDWNNTNGNFRAISLEQNRREGNKKSPTDRLHDMEIRKNSFIKNNDWKYWQEINNITHDDNAQPHFRAITTRMINIYKKFWDDLKRSELT
jgi:hypothetical protein